MFRNVRTGRWILAFAIMTKRGPSFWKIPFGIYPESIGWTTGSHVPKCSHRPLDTGVRQYDEEGVSFWKIPFGIYPESIGLMQLEEFEIISTTLWIPAFASMTKKV